MMYRGIAFHATCPWMHRRTHASEPDFAATSALRLIGPDPRNWVPNRPGIDHNVVPGGGGAYIPPVLAGLPRTLILHTQDPRDFERLRGGIVAVAGAAAAAFDAADVALENGAGAMHLFARRPSIASIPITRLRAHLGAYDNCRQLPGASRRHQAIRFRRVGSTPTIDAIERMVAFANFHLHLGAPWQETYVDT
jgi:hypothetical protein